MAFQRQLRLEYGSWLLLNNACSITQIALDCGFADGAFFIRFPRALRAIPAPVSAKPWAAGSAQ
ncbi:hypothetical protein [Achromobacter sp.]|uniref:hypothetical protein n=1 Tax=Achromobacter sp. TaxID=134375 RepID=UPI003D07866F